MKIVSWNINSIRIRTGLLAKLVKNENPDIVCLQETKTQDSEFPYEEIKSMGFSHINFFGEKSYNGVAILSKIPLHDISSERITNSDHKRHISAKLPDGTILHNFYVPAGGDIPNPQENPKFDFKLKFMDWMINYFNKFNGQQDKIIMLGDINIAPLENDVWSHKQLLDVVSHTPIEVMKMDALQKTLEWIDSSRKFTTDDKKLYSWWSYRSPNWAKSDRGRRLDHIWTTPILDNMLKSSSILKAYRGAQKPSDHAPVVIEIDI